MAKKLKAKEIRALSAAEAATRLRECFKELMKLRSQVASKAQLENPGSIRVLRRTIARLYTIHRSLLGSQQGGSGAARTKKSQ